MAKQLNLGNKVNRELLKTAHHYSQPTQQWRMTARLPIDLRLNRKLMQELYRLANNKPAVVNLFLQYGEAYVRQTAPLLRQPTYQNIDPSHPSVINNIMHPLNPSNPNNLMLNPGLNLLFQASEAMQSAIEENEAEETVENEQAADLTMAAVLMDENIHEAAHQHEPNPEFNPYHTLGLTQNATQEEIRESCLSRLADYAPQKHETPSHHFKAVSAAALLIGLTKNHDAYQLLHTQEKMRASSRLIPPAA